MGEGCIELSEFFTERAVGNVTLRVFFAVER